MLLGAVLGLAIGVAAGWLAAPLAGKELRSKASSPAGRRSLADALKRRDQTLAGVRQAVGSARERAEEVTQAAADAAAAARASAEEAGRRAADAASEVAQKQQTLIDRIRDRIDEARAAARDGYDEGVADAERLYEDVRKGRDLE